MDGQGVSGGVAWIGAYCEWGVAWMGLSGGVAWMGQGVSGGRG